MMKIWFQHWKKPILRHPKTVSQQGNCCNC